MPKFDSKEEYRSWAENQDWYQSIPLSCGIKTNGKFPTNEREAFFSTYDFKGKSVLDIGCNSGEYCFMAKRLGAEKVIGIDVDAKRLEQARTINENESLDVTFLEQGIDEMQFSRPFDIVICIAVLTEYRDVLGGIEKIKAQIGERAFIELDVAKPLLYLPSPRLLFNKGKRFGSFAAARKSKHGWMLSPSMGLLRELFGEDFDVIDRGKNVRYRMLEVRKK